MGDIVDELEMEMKKLTMEIDERRVRLAELQFKNGIIKNKTPLTEAEKKEKNRIKSQKYYEANKAKIRAKDKERRIKKKEEKEKEKLDIFKLI